MRLARLGVRAGRRIGQAGWGLLELLMALFIGMFVLAGLFSLLYNLTQASGVQGNMAVLEDNERVAMMALQNVVETAGYLPQNFYFTTATALPSITGALPAGGSFATTGQFLSGLSSSPSVSDAIGVRYVSGMAASGPDGVTDCVGHTYTTTATNGYPFTTEFYVDSTGTLNCFVVDQATGSSGATYPIVSGLSTSSAAPGLQIKYGVDTTFSGTVNEYLPASSMSAYWYNGSKSNVRSVVFTLNFVNPQYNSTSVGQPATIPVSLTVFLLNSPTST